jgi:hypothetical protein
VDGGAAGQAAGAVGLNYSVGKASEALPILDFWPWRYATDYEFKPGPDCPQPLPRQDPDFHRCYVAVGDFPGQRRPEVAAGTHADRIRRRPRSHPLKVPA